MGDKDNGGSAFPWQIEVEEGNFRPDGSRAERLERHVFRGMSMRDYFAGQALSAANWFKWDGTYPEELAEDCYKIADAMLKEREK